GGGHPWPPNGRRKHTLKTRPRNVREAHGLFPTALRNTRRRRSRIFFPRAVERDHRRRAPPTTALDAALFSPLPTTLRSQMPDVGAPRATVSGRRATSRRAPDR